MKDEQIGAKRVNYSETRPDLQAINSQVITPRNDSKDSKGTLDNLPIVHIKLDEDRRETDMADSSSN